MSKQALRHQSTLTDEQRSASRELRTIVQERSERNEKLKAAKERYDTTQRALHYAETQLHCASIENKDIDAHRLHGARLNHNEARVTLDALSSSFAELERAARERALELYSILPTLSREKHRING